MARPTNTQKAILVLLQYLPDLTLCNIYRFFDSRHYDVEADIDVLIKNEKITCRSGKIRLT